MKAVNLIPREERRGSTAISRSGGGAYIVLGTLAALVLMMAVYATEGGKIGTKQAEAAQTNQQAAALEAKAASMSQYTNFAAMKDKRIATVTSLAESRFDWSHTLQDLARVMPPNTWLTSFTGTVSPNVSVDSGGGGSGGTIRSAINAPAVEISGCTTSQPAVARMMARMRLLDNVQRVTLTSSEKAEQASGAETQSDSSGTGGDCTGLSSDYPVFSIVIFFDPIKTATATSATSTTPATAAPATEGASQ